MSVTLVSILLPEFIYIYANLALDWIELWRDNKPNCLSFNGNWCGPMPVEPFCGSLILPIAWIESFLFALDSLCRLVNDWFTHSKQFMKMTLFSRIYHFLLWSLQRGCEYCFTNIWWISHTQTCWNSSTHCCMSNRLWHRPKYFCESLKWDDAGKDFFPKHQLVVY